VTPLESALLILALFLPFHLLVLRQLRLLTDPAYIRRKGVVIVAEKVLEAHSAPIGCYMGHPIWATVTFMGMQYRFDHVVPRRKRNRIEARELYLDPGLVYLTD
jgi:hypothetical protein